MPADLEALLKKLERHKIERLEKGSEIYKIMAGVFDTSTLLTLYNMINKGVVDLFHGAISTGKEANIFCAIDEEGNYVAVKIYRIATTNFKNKYNYLVDDPRFKKVKHERTQIIYAWVSREFKNLQRAHDAGVSVPRPIDFEKNVLVMEFIGEDDIPYPRMKDSPPEAPKQVFEKLLENVTVLYREARLVHSDLSEYNVMLTPDPVIIDFSMATDIRNPMTDELLMRDLSNIARYFRRFHLKIANPTELLTKIKGE